MKKFISVIVSAALGVSAIAAMPCSAEGTKAAKKSGIVILGDSIASGYTVKGNVPYNYGDICGDYLGCDVYNYAVVGDNTDELLALIEGMNAEQKKNLSNAEYVVISIGGNDIGEYVARKFLEYAASKTDQKFLNDGYTLETIPAKPSISDLMKMINVKGEGGLVEFLSGSYSNALELNSLVSGISANLSYYDERNEGYIANKIIPNVKKAADEIKSVNPDARILVQNIYQPLQLEPTYIAKVYGTDSDKATMINLLRSKFETIMNSFDTELKSVDGIEVVDVKAEFTALDSKPTAKVPGHANYFIDIQTGSLETGDIHPNQKGHLAIAAAVLEKIGKLHDNSNLLRKVYSDISDKDKYPEIALATYKKVAGKEPVITTTTTTSTTTTTKKPTTSTTTSTTTTTKKPTTSTTTSTTTTTKKPTTSTTTSATTTKKPTTSTTTSTTTTTKKPTTSTTTSTATTTKKPTTSTTTSTAKKTTTSLTTTSATTTTTTTPAPTVMYGDVNGDKHVDSVDASQILKEYAARSTGKTGSFTDAQVLAGDVDESGKVDSVDASKVLAYYAYLSNVTGEPKSLKDFINKK